MKRCTPPIVPGGTWPWSPAGRCRTSCRSWSSWASGSTWWQPTGPRSPRSEAEPSSTKPASQVGLCSTRSARARPAIAGLGLAATTSRGFHAEPGFDLLAPLSKADAIEVSDASPHPDDAVHSAVLFVLDADTWDVLARVAAVLPDGVDVSPSGLPGSVELTPPGVHKGSGIAHLCERLGVDRRDVVAFGDGLNDHEMLRWAGRGVAMGNADPATKAVADEITASNDDDGVAVVIERLVTTGARA